ncbi:MAG TPA: hypothetical protein VEQ60_24285 [Longimicrobium sp.]|nr:hypothetical protein [Longimicrobium sp.]
MREREREPLLEAIEGERRRYAAGQESGDDVLPRDQWQVLRDEGHRGHFTEEEVARAGEAFLPPDEAAEFARELYAEVDPGAGIFFPEEMLSALSLVSEEMTERVRALRGETAEEATGRVEAFRRRVALWKAQGSPRDDFPR